MELIEFPLRIHTFRKFICETAVIQFLGFMNIEVNKWIMSRNRAFFLFLNKSDYFHFLPSKPYLNSKTDRKTSSATLAIMLNSCYSSANSMLISEGYWGNPAELNNSIPSCTHPNPSVSSIEVGTNGSEV